MAASSKIEWTEATWNPVTGCTKISSGCLNCYAFSLAKRLQAMGNPRYCNGFKVTLHEDLLDQPLSWRKPRMIFVNSMSDLFHENISFKFIAQVFSTMEKAHWHTFQVLTKRSERLKELAPRLNWPSNVWLGVSVENKAAKHRIEVLRNTPAAIKFLSCEPLIGDIGHLDLRGIDWVIVGGESGPRARVMRPDWARSIRDECIRKNIPFFFKQWGGVNRKKTGRLLDNRIWEQYPNGYITEAASQI